jgi:chemotaxis protein CheX
MNLQKLLTSSIAASTANVFSTMLGRDLGHSQVSIGTRTPDANDGVASFIGIAGAWAGTGSITCSPALACRICSWMLMTEVTAVDEAVLDAIAELTNIIVGGVKTDLETHLGPLGLSLPTVVFGLNFKTRSSGGHEWVVASFCCDGEPLIVKMCLAQSQRKTGDTTAHGELCLQQ